MNGPPERDLAPGAPAWQSLELAWPLSLAAGFVGGWAGLTLGFACAAPALALLAFLPLHWPLTGRADRGPAVLLTLGWLCGLAGAHVGAALDGSDGVGATVGCAWLGAWLERRAAGVPDGWARVLAPSVAVLFGAGLAWLSRGIAGLALAGLGASALAAAVGLRIAQEPGLSALAAWTACPPDFALDVAALAVASTALGGLRASAAPSEWGPGLGRGRALALAAACAVGALVLRASLALGA